MKIDVKKLNTPQKVQDFLDKMPFNFEKKEETYWSPRKALEMGKMLIVLKGRFLPVFVCNNMVLKII